VRYYHLFAITLISALLLSTVLWVDFRTDISDFFFRGNTTETNLIASSIQSGELSRRYILLVETKHQDADEAAFVRDFQTQLREVTGVERVWGMQQDKQVLKKIIADYLPYRMQLFSTTPALDITQLFQQESLDERAKQLKNILLSQEGAWLKPMIVQDPMLLTGDWVSSLGFQNAMKTRGFSGLIVETKVSGLDAKAQLPIYEQLLQTFEVINTEYQEQFSLRLTGVPLFSMAVQQQVSHDLKWISIISIVLMVLLFVSVFRSIRGLVWVSFILICSVAAATLLTSLVFGYIHALTMAIGATLIGVCVDYPIHAMVHAAATGKDNPEASTKQIWPSLLLGGLTTTVGYIALSFTNHPGLQQLALFAGVGIGMALLLTRYLLPRFMHGHVASMKVGLDFKAWLILVQHHRTQKQWLVLAVAVVVFIVGFPNVEWTDDMRKLSPSLASLKAEDQSIRKQVSSIEAGRFVLVEANSFEAGLQRNEQVFTKLQTLQSEGVLQSFYSLYPWLASEKLQQDNLRLFNENITNKHQEMWQRALRKEGLSVKHLGQLKFSEADLLTKEKLERSPHKRYVSGQYVVQGNQVLIMTWLGPHDIEKVKAALLGMEGVRYISQSDIVNNLAADYRAQTLNMLWFGASAILLLLLIRFRNIMIAVNILFPAVVSVCVVIAMWGIAGVAMGMLHLIGLLLAIAICVDYAIFFHENRAGNQGVTFQAISVSSMTTIVAFFSLGFADTPALQAMAWTVAPAVLIGFSLCPLMVNYRRKTSG